MARVRRYSSEGRCAANQGQSDKARTIVPTDQPDRAARRSPRKKAPKNYNEHDDCINDVRDERANLVPKAVMHKGLPSKQIRLAPLQKLQDMSSLRLEPSLSSLRRPLSTLDCPLTRCKALSSRKQPASPPLPAVTTRESSLENAISETDVEESIWCGSHASSDMSDEELPSPSKFFNSLPKNLSSAPSQEIGRLDIARSYEALHISDSLSGVSCRSPHNQDRVRPVSSSDKENDDRAVLRFSPPRLSSPRRERTPKRPVTPPPTSPHKGKLLSPSKRAARLPTPPHRPSLEAFWNAETVNDWNDQYSPRKEWSPKKLRAVRDNNSTSPTASPKKLQSPSKRTKAGMAEKRKWETRKHQVAEDFLAELDRKITEGKVQRLVASTGGVRLVWSRTLNTTAGRANWRRETTRTRQLDGTTTSTHKHHASIELAEKVIDDEERLLNVIAHEFCHLANFMVSGIKDQPHGKQFKDWGRKCTQAFSDRGVEVTTKHSYQIEYKYIWQCSNELCAAEFKRHSKSIDPKRHTCGACRSQLAQIKPVPRRDATGAGGAVTGYAAYVKRYFGKVKASLPAGTSHKEVMEAVGRRYRADKASLSIAQLGENPATAGDTSDSKMSLPSNVAAGAAAKRVGNGGAFDVGDMVKALEVITIDDD